MTDHLWDVAVVGYGPVGATLAALLGAQGLRVLVVERATAIYDKPRAITADHEFMRVMQFAGIGAELGRHIEPHHGTDFVGADGELIKTVEVAPPPYPLGWPTAMHFIQPEFEAMLRERVARLSTVRVSAGVELTDIGIQPERVTLQLRSDTGHGATSESARYVIACDGANSLVRRHLHLELEDLDFDEPWIVVDAWLRRETPLPPRARQYCRPSRPGTAVIGPRNLRRWELKLLPGESPDDFRHEDRLRAALGEFVDVSALELWRRSVYRFHALLARTWRHGRVLLAGDAAHQMPPFLGQGLCAGVRDAGNLAWKLGLVLRRGAAPALLDTYETERRPHVRRIISLAKERGLLIGELDPARAAQRDRRLRAEMRSGPPPSRHQFIPGLEAGLIDAAAPLAGVIFPQPWVTNAAGGRLLFDDVLPAVFLIVGCDSAMMQAAGQPSAAEKRLGVRRVLVTGPAQPPPFPMPADTELLREIESLYQDWARANGVVYAIVRPDRYLYGTATDAAQLHQRIAQLDARVYG